MKFNEYQEISKRTMPKYSNYATHRDTTCNYMVGVAGETGECLDLLKKVLFHGHEFSKDALTKELGDVLHYLAGLATIFGISLEDVAITNIDKLKKRYPDGFNTEDSIARVDIARFEV